MFVPLNRIYEVMTETERVGLMGRCLVPATCVALVNEVKSGTTAEYTRFDGYGAKTEIVFADGTFVFVAEAIEHVFELLCIRNTK